MPIRRDDKADGTAIKSLQSLAAKYPDKPNVALALGMAWYAIGKDDKAKRQLKQAVNLEPCNTSMIKELAGVYLGTNDLPNALEAATKAVAIKPDDVELLGNLSVIQLISGNISAARATIEHAIRLQPTDAVNKGVQKIIGSVVSGERDGPKSLEEMMKPPKRKSWLLKLLGC
jgi:Flp pilus assembly protein TadD